MMEPWTAAIVGDFGMKPCLERNRLVKDFADAEAEWISITSRRDSLERSGLSERQIAEQIAKTESRRIAADQAGMQHCHQHGCANWAEVLDLSMTFKFPQRRRPDTAT